MNKNERWKTILRNEAPFLRFYFQDVAIFLSICDRSQEWEIGAGEEKRVKKVVKKEEEGI